MMGKVATFNLNTKATQTKFADLVGVTQQAISKQLDKGILQAGQTYKTWLKSYCEHLRETAAGRGGSHQENSALANIREKTASAQLKELDFHEKTKALVPVNEIEPMLANWAVLARSEVTNAVSKITTNLESKHNIEIEQDLVDEQLGAAFAAIANYPANLSGDDPEGGEKVEAAA